MSSMCAILQTYTCVRCVRLTQRGSVLSQRGTSFGLAMLPRSYASTSDLKQLGLPKRNMPDWVVRVAALFNPEMAYIAPNLGLRQMADASKSEGVLGWKTRPAAESIIAAANSLFEGGSI